MRDNIYLIAKKSMRKNKSKNKFIFISIMMSVFLFSLLLFLSTSFKDKMINEMKVSNENYLTISFGDKTNSLNYKYLPIYTEKNIESVSKIKGIHNVNGVKISSAESVRTNNKNMFSNTVYGVSNEYFENLDIKLEKGKLPKQKNDIIIGESIARYSDLDVGDTISFIISGESIEFVVCGIIKHQENQSFSSIPSEINQMMAVDINNSIFNNSKYFFINGVVDNSKDIESVSNEIIDCISSDEDIVSSLKNTNISPLVTSRKDVIDMINNWYKYINYFIVCIIGVITIVSVANIINIFNIKISERLKDIMTFFVVGASSKQVKKIFLYESINICIKSIVLGEVLSIAVYLIVINIIGFPIIFSIANIMLPIFCGILTVLLSNYFIGRIIDSINIEKLSNE